jgi:hypothetical protein
MLAFLSLIPGLGQVIQAVLGGMFDAKVKIIQAQTGADRDKAVEMLKTAQVEAHERTSALAVIASSQLLTLLVVAFATPLVIFEFKVIVWDIVLGLGSTDAIRGQVAEWANTIIVSIFGTTGAVTVGKMVLGRKEQG